MKYRKKLKYLISPLLIVSVVFILYQLMMFIQLTSLNEVRKRAITIRGVHRLREVYYVPKDDGKFRCVTGEGLINHSQVNDDYCDCEDGSDEPGTSACPNGLFFCESQVKLPGFKQVINSGMVNDGICDCCDGSDEYFKKHLNFRLNDFVQGQIKRYMSPCVNFCPE